MEPCGTPQTQWRPFKVFDILNDLVGYSISVHVLWRGKLAIEPKTILISDCKHIYFCNVRQITGASRDIS